MIDAGNRHFTKSGPGRIPFRRTDWQVRGVRSRKYPIARKGGNWQGVPYLSYREYDAQTMERLRLNATRADV